MMDEPQEALIICEHNTYLIIPDPDEPRLPCGCIYYEIAVTNNSRILLNWIQYTSPQYYDDEPGDWCQGVYSDTTVDPNA